MAETPAPRRHQRTSPVRRAGGVVLLLLDRYLVQVSAGLVVGIWLLSDLTGLHLSEGTKASLSAFVAYSLVKSRADARWRALEIEREEMRSLISHLDSAQTGTAEATQVRRELVQLARRAAAMEDSEQ